MFHFFKIRVESKTILSFQKLNLFELMVYFLAKIIIALANK